MKHLRNTIIIIGVLIFSCSKESCKGIIIPPEVAEVIEYDNILIYSDLSSRMQKSPNDSLIIEQLIKYFVKDCVKPGKKINDKSSISFSRINYFRSSCPSAKIDIEEITPLEKKQSFVNDESELENLSNSIKDFKSKIYCNYKEKDYGGLDILSLLFNDINNGNNLKKASYIITQYDTTEINYYNHLFVFTDGYLEYSTKDNNGDFFFGEPEIEEIRKYCKKNKVSPEDAFKKRPDFKLPPLESNNNQYVNLYVMETYDRGLNEKRGTLKYSGELSDNNILRIAWQQWAEESGFRNFVWKQITNPSSLPNDYIKKTIIH